MNGFKIENSMEELSMVDLYNTIDYVGNSREENELIVNNIKDIFRKKMITFLDTRFKKKKDRQRKERFLLRYKILLNDLSKLVDNQIKAVNDMIEKKDSDDISEEFIELKKELLEYCMKIFKVDIMDAAEVLNQREQSVYSNVCLYYLVDQYYAKMKNNQISENEEEIGISDWKNQYFFIISMNRQEQYNRAILTYYFEKNVDVDKDILMKKKCNYFLADFQGQLSKNIYCHRKRLKLTQMQLSERSGVDRSMIAKIEKIQQPTTLETAIKLLTSLGLGISIYPFKETEELCVK